MLTTLALVGHAMAATPVPGTPVCTDGDAAQECSELHGNTAAIEDIERRLNKPSARTTQALEAIKALQGHDKVQDGRLDNLEKDVEELKKGTVTKDAEVKQTEEPKEPKAADPWSTPANPDLDGDGIPNVRDECPNAAETPNHFQDGDGCPDEAPVTESTTPDNGAAEPKQEPERTTSATRPIFVVTLTGGGVYNLAPIKDAAGTEVAGLWTTPLTVSVGVLGGAEKNGWQGGFIGHGSYDPTTASSGLGLGVMGMKVGAHGGGVGIQVGYSHFGYSNLVGAGANVTLNAFEGNLIARAVLVDGRKVDLDFVANAGILAGSLGTTEQQYPVALPQGNLGLGLRF